MALVGHLYRVGGAGLQFSAPDAESTGASGGDKVPPIASPAESPKPTLPELVRAPSPEESAPNPERPTKVGGSARKSKAAHRPSTTNKNRDDPLGGWPVETAPSHSKDEPDAPSEVPTRAVFDAIEKSFQTAQAAFVIPDVMVVGKSFHVHFDLSFQRTIEAMVQDLQKELPNEKVKTASLRTSSIAQARLTGQSFQITAITPEEQPVSSMTTTWEWEVVPQNGGRHPLHLSIDAVVMGGSEPLKKTIHTFERQVVVKVSVIAWTGKFVAENWQWLWTTLLVPIAGFVWAKRRGTAKRRHKSSGGRGR
jgi:hypothetical protein